MEDVIGVVGGLKEGEELERGLVWVMERGRRLGVGGWGEEVL